MWWKHKRYSNVSSAVDSRKDSEYIGILLSLELWCGAWKEKWIAQTESLVSVCLHMMEVRLHENDLLPLIPLLGLMNLWRFTQYRQLSWVWYNVFIYSSAVYASYGENVLLWDLPFIFSWRISHKQILEWSKRHLHKSGFVMQYWTTFLTNSFSPIPLFGFLSSSLPESASNSTKWVHVHVLSEKRESFSRIDKGSARRMKIKFHERLKFFSSSLSHRVESFVQKVE